MKVLFAVNNEKIAESITRKYQEEYKEIITSKTVYYYNAIIKELQKDKTYDRIVIGEDLEPFASDNYQAIDKYIFEKMDIISDEATNLEGDNIPIILIGLDRRTKNDPLLLKLFGLGLYDVLIGQDRSIQKVCGLMYKPRSKKEAKAYYRVEADNVNYQAEVSNGVSESEIQNILNHYKKIGNNVPKCVQSFESINSQYSKEQIKLIIEMLPANVKVILEENSDTYRKIMGIKGKKNTGINKMRENEYVEKDINTGNKLTKPVIIPTTVSTKNVMKVNKSENAKKSNVVDTKMKNADIEARKKAALEAKRKEAARIAKEKAELEAKRKEEERIAKEKAELEAKRKEEERVAKEKAELEAKRKEEERIAKEKAELEAKRKEEERIAKEKAELEAKREEERKMKEKVELEEIRKDDVVVEPIKRGRGRPRKIVTTIEEEVVPIKRKRGRPRKEEMISEKEIVLDEDIILANKSNEITDVLNKNIEDEIDYDFIEDEISLAENENNEELFNEEELNDFIDFEDEEEIDEFADFEDEEEIDEFADFEDEEEIDEFADFEDEEEIDEFADFEDEEEIDEFTDFEDEEETDELVGFEDEEESEEFADFEDEEESEELLGFEDEEESEELLGFEDDEELEELPGFEDEEELEELPEFEDNEEELEELPGFEDNEDESDELPGFEDDEEETEELPGFEDTDTEDEIVLKQHNGSFGGINNKNYKYDNNLANSIKDLKETENVETYNVDTDNLIIGNQKIVSFVGTTKNGTSFIVNNLAEVLSDKGIKTAILDLTKNKNSYYIYTNNDDELRKIAHDSFNKLTEGVSNGIEINKNLSVFTSLPGNDDSLDNVTSIIQTLLENFTVVLMDCDFGTDARYFKLAQEIYLVQSLDVLTIQPLTAFLRDLKVKGILEPHKLRIVINKNIRVSSLTEKILIGGMSVYNDPGMTYMTELFDKQTIKYTTVPFEVQTYVKYLDGLVNCKISSKGYSKNFMTSMKNLSEMVYPIINGKSERKYNDYSKRNKKYQDAFSKKTSSTLEKMKKKY